MAEQHSRHGSTAACMPPDLQGIRLCRLPSSPSPLASCDTCWRQHVRCFDEPLYLLQAAFEPPFLGLCSQPGANLDAYRKARHELEMLAGSVFAMEQACAYGSLADLTGAVGAEGHAEAVWGAFAGALGLAAAACAPAAQALASMPPGGRCSGACCLPLPATGSSEACCALLCTSGSDRVQLLSLFRAPSPPLSSVPCRPQREVAPGGRSYLGSPAC